MGLDNQKQEAATGNGLLEKQDNVLDLKHDEKLKLQLEIRKMVDDLKSDVNAKKQTQELENSFRNLLFKTKISVQEYNSTKQKIENLYTEAKGGDQSATIQKMQDEIDHQLARDFVTIDDSVEIYYNSWIKTVNKNQSINALEISFSQEVSRIVRQVNEALLNQEELQRMTYRFELKNLKAEILNRQSGTTWDPLRHPTMGGRNPSINGEVSASQNNNGGEIMDEELDIPDYRGLYIGKYANSNKPIDNGRYFSDADKPGKTYNIYKDNQMSSVMDKILDSEDKDLFKKRSFGVNLSLDSGFAGILDTIANNPGKRMSIGKGNNIYEFVIDPKTEQIKLVSTPEGKRTDGKITDKDLKAMVKSGLLKYEHEKGSILNPQLDNEFAKMAKIMNQAKWADLSTFVALSKSRSKQSSALKEYVNAKENKDLCQAETVFDFLCDRNGDGLVTGSSQERVKGEKNQKDIGNIFGPQLKWSIDQAAAIIDAKYPTEKTINKTTYGERIVIQNIMLNIDLQDSRFADIVSKSQKSSDLYKEFAIYRDLNSCTRENLAASVRAYPEFKVFFGAAIEKINGSPDVLAPDLMDSLTGNVIDRFLEQGDWKFRANLEKKIDKAILDKFGTTVIESQRIKLRENLLSQIMNVADGFTIIGSDSKEGYLKNPGITKEFANKEAKQAFINSLTTQTLSSFALGALRGENSIRIPVDFIKQGHSENGRTIWKVQAGPSIGYDWEENGILLTLGVGGEVAEQYNYKKVINANLDHVKDAKYIGAEGRAIAGTSLNELTIGAEASVGLMRQKDPIMGINQINRQYEHVSKELFRIPSDAKVSTAEDIYNIIKTNISNTNDSYKDFVKNNEKRLLANADFIASFLDAYKVVSLTQSNPNAINALISMLQEGNMEQWRSDLLNNLHGTFDITKLSFGVTTNMLTIACKNNETRPGMTDQNLGADTELNAITGNDKGKSIKLGLFGFYVGARIANWKTSYGVNSQQLAKTRYDIAEGKNTDKYNPKDIAEYAKYLKALFNQEGLSFTPMNGILRISQDKKSPIKIPDLLNIRVTDIAESSVKYNSDEDILDIGNVLEIGAYTTARPDGVVRQLILGSKKYKDGHPLDNWSTAGNTPDVIGTIDGDKYEAVTKADIENKLAKPEYFRGEERSIFLNCFGANGQLDKAAMKANNVEFVADKSSNDVISAGKIIVFRKTGDTYTLSVEPSTIEAGLSLRVINGNYINGQRISFEKTAETSVNFVPESINKTLKPLFDEIDASKYPNLEIANKQNYIDDFMNGTTIDAQVATLKTLLKNKPDFAKILTELNKADITNEAKIYIVNQFKGIFAYSAGYPTMKIAEIYNARTKPKEKSDINKYPFLKAFKNLPLPENVQKDIITERARIQNIQTKYKRTDRSSVNNLFGYTAFYKTKAGVDPTADLVSGGDTKVMKIGSDETFRLAHQDQAKEWISQKLNSEPTEKSMIWEGILKNITDTGMKDILSKLSGTDKDTLIKTGELSIDNGLKKITLDAEAVFYFKAECMNESIGLKVRDISIAEAPVNDVTITKEQILATQVHMSSQSVAGNAKTQKKEVGAQGYVSKASLGIHGKAQNNSTNPGMTDQNLDTNTEL